MYLFDIDTYGNPFDQDKRILDVPEFKQLSKLPKGQVLFRYIVLMYDYMSPYRHMLFEKKEAKLIKDFGITKKEAENPAVYPAIAMYRELQYDTIIETDLIYKQKIAESSEYINCTALNEQNFDAMQKMMLNHEKIVQISLRMREQVKDLFEAKKKGKMRGNREPTYAMKNAQKNYDEAFNS